MHPDVDHILFTEEEITAMVKRVGAQISEDYKDKDLVLIAVLRGAVVFMGDLMRAIAAELEEERNVQLLLDLAGDAPGRQQRESDLDALRRRLEEIPGEIESESAHIRGRFSSPAARLFPVAVTWIIPRRAVLEFTGGNA